MTDDVSIVDPKKRMKWDSWEVDKECLINLSKGDVVQVMQT
jgi:hypothetical protein